ncbi:neuroserpin-like [Planococcus citri]|uniref:neuroserpin-like n=1 Tax=Planococcus citri TaxID=170843 RepID=UPI0031F74261
MEMFRTATFLFVVGQFVFVKSQSHITEPSMEEKIRDEIFGILQMQTKALWRGTPSDQNIEFLPLSVAAGWQMMLMKLHYYGSPPEKFNYKNDFLKKAYALAGILDKMSSTSNAKLKFVNTVFYDQSKTSKQLLNDLKTYYHAEAYEVSFNSEAAVLAVVNERLSNVTKGRSPKAENLPITGEANMLSSLINYTSCWDTPKTWTNFIKLLKFKNSNDEFDIETFNAKETIGYYNNIEQKYEAIRLPFKKGEFAMMVVLPYQDQSLKFISEFTGNEHKLILQLVSENYENIDYAIPFMNLMQLTVNENGTAIYGDDTITCDWPTAAQETQEINKIDYKPFYVNRPFAVYIYHEKTKFVVMYGLVNNPALDTMQPRMLKIQMRVRNDKTDL